MEVLATDFAFEPNEIAVEQGTPVKLALRNEGAQLHDFTVDEMPVKVHEAHGDQHGGHDAGRFALHLAAEADNTATLEFTPTKAGTYTFYCTVPGHREAGMLGTLVVR